MIHDSVYGSVEVDQDVAGPTYEVASYLVYPSGYAEQDDVPGREQWRLLVADAGDGWAIRRRGRCLNFRGQFEHEPPASARTPEFLHRCRFTERAALLRARHHIDVLRVEEMTFSQYVAQFRAAMRERVRAELAEQAEPRRPRGWTRLVGRARQPSP